MWSAGGVRRRIGAGQWCEERPLSTPDVPGVRGSRRLSCAVVHLLSTILALSLDPKEILNDLSPYGELGLMLIVFAETGLLIGFFLPGDSLLFTAGILANQGKLNLAAVLIGCFVAAVVGDQLGFTIGQRMGPRLLRRPDSRFFKREFIDRTEDFFDRHGAKTIVLARFVPIVRTFAPVVAGIGKMSRRTFISFNVIGAFIWVFGVTLAGYLLADVIGDSIDTYLYPLIAAIIVISLIPPFIEWLKAKKQAPAQLHPGAGRSRSRRPPPGRRRRLTPTPPVREVASPDRVYRGQLTQPVRRRRLPAWVSYPGCLNPAMADHSDDALAELASRQHGIFAARHLDALAYSEDARHVRLSSRALGVAVRQRVPHGWCAQYVARRRARRLLGSRYDSACLAFLGGAALELAIRPDRRDRDHVRPLAQDPPG